MENSIEVQVQEMVKKLSLTNPDLLSEKDPYILTKDEEDAIVKNLILEQKKFLSWKMLSSGMSEQQIEIAITKKTEDFWNKKINKQLAFDRVNSNKHYAIWLEEKHRNESEEKKKKSEEKKKRCDAKYFYNLISFVSKEEYGKKLIVNEQTTPLIKVICYYLSEDPRFETELGYSFSKGLLLRGISGLGKTHIMKCVQFNELKPIQILSMLEITDTLKKEGEFNIDTSGYLYLDDVGTESTVVNHYGTQLSFFKNFIELYYLKHTVYNKLIMSTNCDFDMIEEKYGFRVRSRIREMMNVAYITGTDMRK